MGRIPSREAIPVENGIRVVGGNPDRKFRKVSRSFAVVDSRVQNSQSRTTRNRLNIPFGTIVVGLTLMSASLMTVAVFLANPMFGIIWVGTAALCTSAYLIIKAIAGGERLKV